MGDIKKYEQHKAGIIPYYIEDNLIYMMFMIPSNPLYGGSQPQIAKGLLEETEISNNQFIDAAIREGTEELGLRIDNIVSVNKIWDKRSIFKKSISNFKVYSALIKDKDKFDPFHYETGETVWLTDQNFSKEVRFDHIPIVFSLIRSVA